MNQLAFVQLWRSTSQVLPCRPLFVAVSGAHLYGFPSPDSDIDLRGAYLLPLRGVLGLGAIKEHWTSTIEQDGTKLDMVFYDLKRLFWVMLHRPGSGLEALHSLLVVHDGGHLDELRCLARGCITRRAYHHYAGFAGSRIAAFESGAPRRVKTLLYIYRLLMTGIHVLETGQIEASLPRLNQIFGLSLIPDLIAQKREEQSFLADGDLAVYRLAITHLQSRLETAYQQTSLPDAPTNRSDLDDFSVRVRLESIHE